jgi:hypothetical protein
VPQTAASERGIKRALIDLTELLQGFSNTPRSSSLIACEVRLLLRERNQLDTQQTTTLSASANSASRLPEELRMARLPKTKPPSHTRVIGSGHTLTNFARIKIELADECLAYLLLPDGIGDNWMAQSLRENGAEEGHGIASCKSNPPPDPSPPPLPSPTTGEFEGGGLGPTGPSTPEPESDQPPAEMPGLTQTPNVPPGQPSLSSSEEEDGSPVLMSWDDEDGHDPCCAMCVVM